MNKKYFIPAAIILIVIIIGLCYCIFKPCDHEWENATCTEPATCSICGETAGDPLGHNWAEATCTEPKTCLTCGKTEGEPLGHDWVEATYNAPKTCSICGETDGEPLEKPRNSNTLSSNSHVSTTSSAPTIEIETPRCLLCNSPVVRPDTPYCSMHGCERTGCPYPAKISSSGGYGSYCEFHSCHYPGCTSYPGGGAIYCGAHNGNK